MIFSWPIWPPPPSTRGQLFGAVNSPGGRPHEGLDMGTLGDAVRAAAAGTVLESRVSGDARGRMVRLDHGTDETGASWETRYYHLNGALVSRGDTVEAAEPIAVAGMTGLPYPHPHLHFEVRRDGALVDPQTVLPDRDSIVGAGKVGGNLLALAVTGGLLYVAMR